MLSAADQLNHLREVAISGELPAPVSVVQAPVPRTRSGDSGGSSRIAAESGKSSAPL